MRITALVAASVAALALAACTPAADKAEEAPAAEAAALPNTTPTDAGTPIACAARRF